MQLQTQQPTLTIFQAASLLFSNPTRAFTLAVEQWRGKQVITLFALYGVLIGMNGFDLNSETGFPAMGLLFVGVLGLTMGWLGLYIMATLTKYGDRWFGAKVDPDNLVTAFALAAVPAILFHAILFIANMSAYAADAYPLFPAKLLYGLKMVVTLYSLALACIANYTISKLSLAKSVVALVLPLAVMYGGILLFFKMLQWF